MASTALTDIMATRRRSTFLPSKSTARVRSIAGLLLRFERQSNLPCFSFSSLILRVFHRLLEYLVHFLGDIGTSLFSSLQFFGDTFAVMDNCFRYLDVQP